MLFNKKKKKNNPNKNLILNLTQNIRQIKSNQNYTQNKSNNKKRYINIMLQMNILSSWTQS